MVGWFVELLGNIDESKGGLLFRYALFGIVSIYLLFKGIYCMKTPLQQCIIYFGQLRNRIIWELFKPEIVISLSRPIISDNSDEAAAKYEIKGHMRIRSRYDGDSVVYISNLSARAKQKKRVVPQPFCLKSTVSPEPIGFRQKGEIRELDFVLVSTYKIEDFWIHKPIQKGQLIMIEFQSIGAQIVELYEPDNGLTRAVFPNPRKTKTRLSE